jgi:hypothetical protein
MGMANVRLRRRLGHALLLSPAGPLRASRLILTTWVLAFVGIWVTQQVHASLHEHLDLPPLLHLLRDGSLAVPFAALAVCLGGLIAGELVRAGGRDANGLVGRMTWAVVAALVFAALSIPGSEMHSLLFGAESEGDILADLLGDTVLMLGASLVVLCSIALTPLAPWPAASSDEVLVSQPARASAGGPHPTRPTP